MKRYEILGITVHGGLQFVEREDGDWSIYSEVERELARQERKIGLLEAARSGEHKEYVAVVRAALRSETDHDREAKEWKQEKTILLGRIASLTDGREALKGNLLRAEQQVRDLMKAGTEAPRP